MVSIQIEATSKRNSVTASSKRKEQSINNIWKNKQSLQQSLKYEMKKKTLYTDVDETRER